MAGKLKGRLARIRELGLVHASDLAESSARKRAANERRGPPPFLDDWERAGDQAWTRRLRFDDHLPESVDPSVFAPLRRVRAVSSAESLARHSDRPERIASVDLRLFDLETTGLSGGAGTIAFLAAVGRLAEGEFELTQVFLEDFPGEPSFLAALLPLLEGGIVVSYNGRAFDMPLLRTRCVMNGFAVPEPSLHIDALYASRRLWKRVHGGASLGLLEREVLGLERSDDIPGALIPEVWLAFAREGESRLMPQVLSHNADDVVGLARLLARAQGVFDAPRRFLSRSTWTELASAAPSWRSAGRGRAKSCSRRPRPRATRGPAFSSPCATARRAEPRTAYASRPCCRPPTAVRSSEPRLASTSPGILSRPRVGRSRR